MGGPACHSSFPLRSVILLTWWLVSRATPAMICDKTISFNFLLRRVSTKFTWNIFNQKGSKGAQANVWDSNGFELARQVLSYTSFIVSSADSFLYVFEKAYIVEKQLFERSGEMRLDLPLQSYETKEDRWASGADFV